MAEVNSTTQAASALTGISDVLSPVFTLWYLQKNITNDIAPYVTPRDLQRQHQKRVRHH